MRASSLCVAMIACLCGAMMALADDAGVPTPPPREHPVGDVPLEQGPKVTAEAPKAEAPKVETPRPAEPPPVDVRRLPEVTPAPQPVKAEPPVEPAPEPVKVETIAEVDPVTETPVETEPTSTEPAAPDVTSTLKSEPDVARPMEMQVPAALSVSSDMNEVELAEQVAVGREAYRLALEALKAHYVAAHNAIKRQWVEDELAEFEAAEKYHYLSEVELAGPHLKPVASVSAADQLFREGMEFKNYPAFPPEKRDKLKLALQKFRTIIGDYPTSDKIDDAAFRMGEIYGGWYFNDYARAVVCYERCVQWNPETSHPARFNAAQLYDQKLMMRDKAVRLYNQVVLSSQNTQHVDEARRRLNELTKQR